MTTVWIAIIKEWHEDYLSDAFFGVYDNSESVHEMLEKRRESEISEANRQFDNQIAEIQTGVANGDVAPNRAKKEIESIERQRKMFMGRHEIVTATKDGKGQITYDDITVFPCSVLSAIHPTTTP